MPGGRSSLLGTRLYARLRASPITGSMITVVTIQLLKCLCDRVDASRRRRNDTSLRNPFAKRSNRRRTPWPRTDAAYRAFPRARSRRRHAHARRAGSSLPGPRAAAEARRRARRVRRQWHRALRRASAGVQRRGAELELGATLEALPASRLDLTLVQALPKSDAMDLIVQKATELGVRTIVPVYTEFSVVKLDADRVERRLEHWRKIAQSACEQCGRHQPPAIRARRRALGSARRARRRRTRRSRSISTRAAGSPEAPTPAHAWSRPWGRKAASARTIGGASTRRGFRRTGLGPRVLRAETAAIAACAVAQALWGDL